MSFAKMFPRHCVITDNIVFTLHYRWTVVLLLYLSFVVTCRLLLGDSFYCLTDANGKVDPKTVDHYCYSKGTFIDLSYWNNSPENGNPYRGIGSSNENSKKVYFAFYHRINLFLLLQAFLFSLPHLIWKAYEKGLTFQLTANMNLHMGEQEKALSLCTIAKYLVTMQGRQKIYTFMNITCEFLNHIIALTQIVALVDVFQVSENHLHGLLGISLETWEDFRGRYFPLASQCLFHTYDFDRKESSSTDFICILPLNKMYMTIFFSLYGWYIFLAISSGIVLVYRMILGIAKVRAKVMRWRSPLADPQIVKSICSRSSYSDWFFLSRLQKNLLPTHFAELIGKVKVVSQCCVEMNPCEELIADQMITTSFSGENESK